MKTPKPDTKIIKFGIISLDTTKLTKKEIATLSEILPLVEIEIKKAFRKKPFRTKAK